jgi:hypothetical protein
MLETGLAVSGVRSLTSTTWCRRPHWATAEVDGIGCLPSFDEAPLICGAAVEITGAQAVA